MFLLIDECCGKALIAVAEILGHTAQRTRDAAALGEGAEDQTIFDFARRHGAVLVTINRADFADLAEHGRDHPGVIILPSVIGQELARLFRIVLPIADAVLSDRPNMFVEIEENGRVTGYQLP
ncbi:Predicted nuclease, contains PIN domain, potential toxin-antitoxin system component [Rhizobiales bacterium GAS191]|nr:Predicted nuclease, contains PIN domain, potential toxin-antitoxin system component [Rhizobiales bacterium GAS191]